jgi:predicted nucleic acid-binding protein
MEQIKRVGILIEPPISTIPMPDETDRIFYDTAKASGAFLITGNIRHYPTDPSIITPTDFLENQIAK